MSIDSDAPAIPLGEIVSPRLAHPKTSLANAAEPPGCLGGLSPPLAPARRVAAWVVVLSVGATPRRGRGVVE